MKTVQISNKNNFQSTKIPQVLQSDKKFNKYSTLYADLTAAHLRFHPTIRRLAAINVLDYW